MRWSAAIAGKTGRCKCGAAVRVPREIEPPADLDLLDALAEPTAPVVEANIAYNAPPPVPAVPLQYQPVRPQAAGNPAGIVFTPELLYEFILPGVVLVLGFVAMMGWLSFHGSLVAAAVIVVLFLATVAMVVKTIVLSLFAWYLASKTGGSFGNPLSTILKIAALVVALDAAIVWTLNAMVGLGMITRRGETYVVWAPLVDLFLVTLVAAALISRFVYGLRGDEAKLFSRFVAGGNLVINVLVFFVLYALAVSAAQSARQARAYSSAYAAPAASSPVATTSPSPQVVTETMLDRQISARLGQQAMRVMEGRDWETSPQFHSQDRPIGQLINQMYNFRAPKVYVETLLGRAGLNAGIVVIDIELPASAQDREGCFSAVAGFEKTNKRCLVFPPLPTTGRFIEIRVAR